MKPLLVSSYDVYSGADRSAYRLHQGLRSLGIDSHLLVQTKVGHDSSVLGPVSTWKRGLASFRPSLDHLPLRLYAKREATIFSIQWLPGSVHRDIASFSPDVVNLH